MNPDAVILTLLLDRIAWIVALAIGLLGWAGVGTLLGLIILGLTHVFGEEPRVPRVYGDGPAFVITPAPPPRLRLPVAPRPIIGDTQEYEMECMRPRPVWNWEATTVAKGVRYTRDGVVEAEGFLVPTAGGVTWHQNVPGLQRPGPETELANTEIDDETSFSFPIEATIRDDHEPV